MTFRSTAVRAGLVGAGPGDGVEIHPLMQRPMPFGPLEFDIPAEATRSGELHLRWTKEPGIGGAGRGLQVAEVWLMRK